MPAPSINGWEHTLAGKVMVQITVDENGTVTSATALPDSGRTYLLTVSSEKAALKATFPKKRLKGVLVYEFPIPENAGIPTPAASVTPTPAAVKTAITDSYFTDVSYIAAFADVKDTEPFYVDLKGLVSSRIAFGYADKKFHAEMYLTRGDLAYFLGKTMDSLKGQASLLKLDLARFYRPYHDLAYRRRPISDITDLKPSQPYYSQVVNLVNKYQIYLFDFESSDPMTFHAAEHLTNEEVMALFRHIFRGYGGDFNSTITDRVPSDDGSMKRGEFAIYLNQFDRYMNQQFVLESIADSKRNNR